MTAVECKGTDGLPLPGPEGTVVLHKNGELEPREQKWGQPEEVEYEKASVLGSRPSAVTKIYKTAT